MSNESIVVVVEKPWQLKQLARHLLAQWPNRTLYVVATLGMGLYEFRYPRGLRMADYPYVGEPAWRAGERGNEPTWEMAEDGRLLPFGLSPSALLLQPVETVVFAADPDPRGVLAFHVLLTQALGCKAALSRWPALRLFDYSTDGMQAAFDAIGSTEDAWFVLARNAGLARRFFDYNYNVNALAFFTPLLSALDLARRVRSSEAASSGYRMSKYSLQLLYALRNDPVPERPRGVLSKLLEVMRNWRGSGKYPSVQLGTPSSHAEIVHGLQAMGLIDGVGLTEAGRHFLDQLHPDCCDPDLPARIRKWEQAWPASRPSMERYLRTFFGKQKRFSAPGRVAS